MKLLIIKTDISLSKQAMTNIYGNLKLAKKEGILILDGSCRYEIVEFDSVVMNIENLTYEISKLKYESKNNSINELCEQAFETAKSKGWHDKARAFGEAIALIHAEASEALEADRRNEGKERVAEELADICIRVFDASMEFGVDLETAIKTKMEYNKQRSYKHGNKKY